MGCYSTLTKVCALKKVREIFCEEKGINVAVYIWKEKILHEKRRAF